MVKRLIKKLRALRIYAVVIRFLFPYQTWIKMREESNDEYGEKLCYCGHTYKCTCGNPDKKCFNESVKRGSIILWDENNAWKSGL
jgi:hypothetical protein